MKKQMNLLGIILLITSVNAIAQSDSTNHFEQAWAMTTAGLSSGMSPFPQNSLEKAAFVPSRIVDLTASMPIENHCRIADSLRTNGYTFLEYWDGCLTNGQPIKNECLMFTPVSSPNGFMKFSEKQKTELITKGYQWIAPRTLDSLS